MTREEAIQILADLTDNLFLHTWEEQYKALHMAIDALSVPQTDLISRTKLFNKLATVQAPPEANEYKAEVYKIIQSMGTEENDDK